MALNLQSHGGGLVGAVPPLIGCQINPMSEPVWNEPRSVPHCTS